MTQPTEAVGGEAVPAAETNPADYFTQLAEEQFGITDEEQDETPVEGAEEQSEAAEGADDETGLEEEADDLPPIEAPVSWDAEAKEVFKTLPREAQEIVQKREAERERFVQSKSQEAARAKETAVQQAQAELAQIQAQFAQQYQSFADSIQVSEPDPMLQVQDPIAYAQQMRAFQQANAQRTAAQQAAQQHAQQAQWQALQVQQAENAEQHRIIVENFPEYADPTTGPELQRKLTAAAKRLGYTDELISQARATDILAMRNVAEAFDKADKYDALQKTKMEKVRAAKGKPPVTTRPGVAQGADQVRARNTQSLKEVLATTKNRDVQGNAFYELAKNNGWLS
jgi:hypothetical protein